MIEPLTGWMNTDALRQVNCPRCKAVAPARCKTPKGRRLMTPHNERIKALIEKVGLTPYKRDFES